MKKIEIIINGVHHVLVDVLGYPCKGCSLINECNSQNAKGAQLCELLGGSIDSHFEIKNIQEDIFDEEPNPNFQKDKRTF